MKARIDKEVKEQKAQADLFTEKTKAEADYIKAMKEADASFYAKQKEAEGMTEMARAYGELAQVLGGPAGLLQYMMLQNGTYEKLAATNAKAINGLQPKISVWSNGKDEVDASAPLRNLYQNLPPLLQTVQEQTGIGPPAWLATMTAPAAQGQGQGEGQGREVMDLKKARMTNGA